MQRIEKEDIISESVLLLYIMPVPKRHLSKRRTRSRRAHHALQPTHLTTCPKCNAPMKPHNACPACGEYRGRNVLKKAEKVEKKIAKESKKKREKAEKTTASQDKE